MCLFPCSTEELADALLADELRKSKAARIQTQAQVHHPISASSRSVVKSNSSGPVTSTPRVGTGENSADVEFSSGADVEEIQQKLAITTQELKDTKEALDKSEKKLLEMQDRGEAGGKDLVQI